MSNPQVLILDINGKSTNPLYSSWTSSLSLSWMIVTDYDCRWNPPSQTALIVTAQHYQEPEYGILMRMAQSRVPTLIIADGILDYRNTWQNPGVAAGCLFQPVIGHKIACLGRSQMRFLESWGNVGKCELVGSPRMDQLIGKSHRRRVAGEPFRFLVMTAKKLGFTPDQVMLTKRSIRDLKLWFSHHPQINGTPTDVVWRLSEQLDQEMGVTNQLRHFDTGDLATVLDTIDAVITTSSTSMLEAMLYGIPVALLDYHNCPHYVPAAWTITAPRHLDQIMPELMNPPAAKVLYQETVLHDALEARTPARPRMVELVEAMVRTAKQCQNQEKPLAFPTRIMSDPQHGYHLPEETFDMGKLYPKHPVFGEPDRIKLQVHINQLQMEIDKLRNKIRTQDLLRELLGWFPGPRKMARCWRSLRDHRTKNCPE